MNYELIHNLLKAVKMSIKDVATSISNGNVTEVYLTKGRGKAIIRESKNSYSIKVGNNPTVQVLK